MSRGALGRGATLSVYVLPGRVTDPKLGIVEAVAAEQAGFDGVYVSERLDMKEASATCGALAAVTERVAIGTAVIHQGTRHPLTIAAMAATIGALSGGRFVLGIGRGLGALTPSLGVSRTTLATMDHLASTLRRLWNGERITEVGPAGSFRGLRFSDVPPRAPRLLFGTVGPRGLELAGRSFDGVILHPFLTPAAVAESTAVVRAAAESAGRDPNSVHVVTTLVAAPDMNADRTDLAVRARAVSYFQVRGLGEQLVERNGWDPAVLTKLRAHQTLAGTGIADTAVTRSGLVAASEELPDEWFETAAAVGSTDRCIAIAREFAAAGADEVLIHGASPTEARGVAERWRGDT